jgi:hypothetical protein
MPIFRRLIQNPSSPEKSLKALTGAAKYKGATFARLADLNDLARSVDDQIVYTLDTATTAAGTVAITTKKGIVKVTNASTSSTTLTLTLTNSELAVADVDKYFIQATIASATSFTPSVKIVPVTEGQFGIVVAAPSAINWATNPTYVYYNIVRTGD